MTETLAHGYSSERTQREVFNEYQHDRVWMVLKKSLCPCAVGEISLSIAIGRVSERCLEFQSLILLHLECTHYLTPLIIN